MSLPEIPAWLRGSEMGLQIFAHDWTESGLGPIENWPPQLQLAVNIVLLLPSAAILLWGPDFIQIYNDRFRDTMGGKQPDALGQPVRVSWPEAWDFTAPIIEGVMMRRESHVFEEQRLVLNRKGAPEECFLRLTYSPVPGALPGQPGFDETPPGGVLVTVLDTTELVMLAGARRSGSSSRTRSRQSGSNCWKRYFVPRPRSSTCFEDRISFSNLPVMRITSLSAGAS